MMKKMFYVACCLFLSGILSACAVNLNTYMPDSLTAEYLNNSFQTKPIDLAAAGQCPGTLALKVVNKETRKDRYMLYDDGLKKYYIIPDEFTQFIVKYMEEKLRESGLTVDDVGGKEIYVSIKEIQVQLVPFGGVWALTNLKITIPEINYTRTYSGREGSGLAQNALANAVHFPIQDFLKDPVVQKYVQCCK
jgi:hypothetical protein